MKIKETKQKLKERIALGLTYGLKAVEEVLSTNAEVFDELINYKSQFNDLNNFASKGLFDYAQFEIGSNKIRSGLLDLIDRIETSDLKGADRIPEPKNDDLQHRRTNFFQLLRLHENNLENLKYEEDLRYGNELQSNLYLGRQALDRVYEDFFKWPFKEKDGQDICDFSRSFFEKDRFFLEVYFNTIGFLMAYIDENEIDRSFYIGVLKSVLSRQELAFLFYYSISDIHPGFKSLVLKTELIHEGIKTQLIDVGHFDLLRKVE